MLFIKVNTVLLNKSSPFLVRWWNQGSWHTRSRKLRGKKKKHIKFQFKTSWEQGGWEGEETQIDRQMWATDWKHENKIAFTKWVVILVRTWTGSACEPAMRQQFIYGTHLSSILVDAFSYFSSSCGIWVSSSHELPQPKTRARSLPVPSGRTPTWHCFCQHASGHEELQWKILHSMLKVSDPHWHSEMAYCLTWVLLSISHTRAYAHTCMYAYMCASTHMHTQTNEVLIFGKPLFLLYISGHEILSLQDTAIKMSKTWKTL